MTHHSVSHLSVCVLHCGDVGVSESAFDKPKDQRALPHTAGAEHHHPVVVTLLGHSGIWCPPAAMDNLYAEEEIQRRKLYYGRN